ncbi:hypothetical protein RIF29_22491 [Crotalaria pallida]|uniref:Uncharacterized protein n=1 Tax=Crotalaria pallida TaxID=3830 RepID=A0AAN9IEI0_CROPI
MSDIKDKRKHGGDDAAVPKSQKKARGDEEVTDEEVEEFYAIIRRLKTAMKYFKSGDDVAALEKEMIKGMKEARWSEREEEEAVEQSLSLDLNLTPPSQP